MSRDELRAGSVDIRFEGREDTIAGDFGFNKPLLRTTNVPPGTGDQRNHAKAMSRNSC